MINIRKHNNYYGKAKSDLELGPTQPQTVKKETLPEECVAVLIGLYRNNGAVS